MKRATWLVCGLAAVLLTGGSLVVAQEAGEGGKAKKARKAGQAGRKAGGGARKGRAGRRPAFDYAAIGTEMALSGEQTEKLTGLILYYQLMLPLQRAKLEEDQKAKVKKLCADAAKDVLNAANPRAHREALTALAEKVANDALNEEQKQKFRSPFGGKRRKKADSTQ